MSGEDRAPEGVVRVRARNPSAFTLDGTNSYVVGRWVVDPGPRDDAHLKAVLAAAADGIEGIVLTHDHADHSGNAHRLAERAGGAAVLRPADGETAGPLRAMATPGHSPDHVCLLHGRICFTGDAVAGTGSSFIAPGGGGLGAYLRALERLRELDLEVLCPGHGPFVHDPRAKLDEYIEHRLDRERRLLAALGGGLRTRDELLDAAWDDVPWHLSSHLRDAAALTLQAHLEKLRDEGRLPAGVEGV